MEHYQYLMVLAASVAATLPLEVITGARVYRRPRCAFARWDGQRSPSWLGTRPRLVRTCGLTIRFTSSDGVQYLGCR